MQQKRKVNHTKVDNKDLLFIADVPLRKKIQNAIETASSLYILTEKDQSLSTELSKELRRTIILYSASTIEAVLLYIFKKKNYSIDNIEYKEPHVLSKSYQNDKNFTLVVAKQTKVAKHERELMIDVLLKFFVDKGMIDANLEAKIKKAKDVRNTFHLSKSRQGLYCSRSNVDVSTDALYNVIQLARNY